MTEERKNNLSLSHSLFLSLSSTVFLCFFVRLSISFTLFSFSPSLICFLSTYPSAITLFLTLTPFSEKILLLLTDNGKKRH